MVACVFCAIVAGREPASVVYEDAATLAFMDLRQANPGHVLVIPKVHVELVYDLNADTAGRLFQATVVVARALRESLAPAGLNLSQSNGAVAGQEVPHVHMHLFPRRAADGLFRIYGERPRVAGRAELDALAEQIRGAIGASRGVGSPAPAETYTYGANPAVEAAQMRRTAAEQADFFLPHLRPGMRLLDAGCGGGSITLGLAEAVAPGEVIGVDLEELRFDGARRLAAERGLTNLRFQRGDLYALPFPDASFDAVFVHHVLQHLGDPPRALREVRRVLRPGGIAGVRDPDEGATLIAPLTPRVERLLALTQRLREHNGGSPNYARHQRRLLLEAGFARAEAQVAVRGGGTAELTREVAWGLGARLAGPSGGEALVALGWVTEEELAAMLAELHAWGERPDAFYSGTFCSAVGWVSAED